MNAGVLLRLQGGSMAWRNLFFVIVIFALASDVWADHENDPLDIPDLSMKALLKGDQFVVVLWEREWQGRLQDILVADGWEELHTRQITLRPGVLVCPVVGETPSGQSDIFRLRCFRVRKNNKFHRVFGYKNVAPERLSMLITHSTHPKLARKQ